MPSGTISFHDHHLPVLEDGEYEIGFKQTVTIAKSDAPPNEVIQGPVIKFRVAGPRFAIDSTSIHSAYPPVGGKGDYMASLPNLVLNRNTLPWERSAIKGGSNEVKAPWLYLLVSRQR